MDRDFVHRLVDGDMMSRLKRICIVAGLVLAPTMLLAASQKVSPIVVHDCGAGNSVQAINADGTETCASSGGGGSTTIVAPQGRLTLVTATPVMASDQTAKATIYYDNFVGNQVPYYSGSADALDTIASGEVSTVLESSGTGVQNASDLFDVWWVHGGANRLCVATNGSGGGWTSDTGGSTTARGTGYTQLDKTTRGYITNKNALTHCYNATTDYGSVSANQATYLGTFYTTAAGQTGMAFKPAAAAGGANAILGLFNAYNQVLYQSASRDSTASWTYATNTWRSANNNNNNRVSWVDGLGISPVRAAFHQTVNANSGTAGTGVDFDSTSATPAGIVGATNVAISHNIGEDSLVSVGFHFAQAMETANGATMTFYGSLVSTEVMGLIVQLEM